MKDFIMIKKLIGALLLAQLSIGSAFAGERHHHHWDYVHPEKWGDAEVNKLCSVGQTQSPINITKVTKPATQQTELLERYKSQDFKISNNGHSIVFDVADETTSHILLNGVRYDLLQFHYHIPSEHTVMNAHYPLEIHFVHKNAQNGLAVVGLLVNAGKHNADLQRILTNLPKNEQDKGLLENFNIGWLMPKDTTVYNYDGSLTTPPCSEQVQWLLKAVPTQADSQQLKTLADLYNGNNRPVQPQNNRTVLLVD